MATELTPIDLIEQPSPANPPTGFLRFFAKSDKKPWIRDSNGVETDLTTGASGGGSKAFSYFVS